MRFNRRHFLIAMLAAAGYKPSKAAEKSWRQGLLSYRHTGNLAKRPVRYAFAELADEYSEYMFMTRRQVAESAGMDYESVGRDLRNAEYSRVRLDMLHYRQAVQAFSAETRGPGIAPTRRTA